MTPEEYQMLLMRQQTQSYKPAGNAQAISRPETDLRTGQNPMGNALNPDGRQMLNVTGPDLSKAATANGAILATSLATGAPIRSADGRGWINPMDVMRQQSAQGTPIGMLYDNAAGGSRENQLLRAGAARENAYAQGAVGLASGATGADAFQETNQALGRLQSAGDADMGAARGQAQAAGDVASGMNQDVARLRSAANGEVPSAAQIQQRQGINDAINSQAALAASARGGNLAAAMRGAGAAGAGIQARGVADAAALRANEMAAARGQLTQATGTQGQLFGQAGSINNALAQTGVQRANAGVVGAGNVGTNVLGSQMQGVSGLGNAAQMEQGRVGSAIAQDRQDQNDLNNFLLQSMNVGQGNAASIYGADSAAATAQRQQNMQLLGSAASGLGASLAGFSMR